MRAISTMAAVAILAGSAHAAETKTFENIKEETVELAVLLQAVSESKRDCSCLDEFEEKACKDARAAAIETLKQKVSAEACRVLGENVASGRIAGERDATGAYQALTKAIMSCDRNSGDPIFAAHSCGRIAAELNAGRVIPKDLDRAGKYAARACKGHDADACRLVEQLKNSGK